MLDPNSRELYLSALRPPTTYSLDRAIGTTFTLDLSTLLAIPLSFAKFEFKNKDELFKDPVSVLEAIRRLSGKFYIFCQSGQIKVPSSVNPLFHYLERSVIEVTSPHAGGIFHPKIWILRFVDDAKKKIIYRFLCLSRNVTYDKSWDTILALEGEVRRRLFARNRALSDFLKALPSLAKKKPQKHVLDEIRAIAEEVRHVDFKQPDGFYDDFCFWPLGIANYKNSPFQNNHWRILVVSPFLSDSILDRLAGNSKGNILISQIEDLDALRPETRGKFKEIYYMDEAACELEDIESEILTGELRKDSVETSLSGLHAKLFLAESGWDAHLWTGSANATSAAFDGKNIEFLVQLKGKKSRIGIDKLLAQREGVTSLPDLLVKYEHQDIPVPEEEKIRKELEKKLEKIRMVISNANLDHFVKSHPAILSSDP